MPAGFQYGAVPGGGAGTESFNREAKVLALDIRRAASSETPAAAEGAAAEAGPVEEAAEERAAEGA